MPELELTPEMIGPDRDRLTLSYISGVMLWPNDPAQRAQAAEGAYAANMREITNQYAMAVGPDKPGPALGDLVSIFARLANAPPLPQIHRSAQVPFARGVVTGLIFRQALQAYKTGRNRNLQQIKAAISRALGGKPGFESLSPSTIENLVWTIYRPVAHYWAASALLGYETGATVDPCRLRDLPRFLGLSEALRTDGEQTSTGPGKTLLDPGRTWRVPDSLRLDIPRVEYLRPEPSKSD